jgi:hypothetical protein
MVLSAEDERRYLGPVEGESGNGFAVDGEKETAKTGPACPIKRRELDGLLSLSLSALILGNGLPSSVQMRMYDC